MKKHYRRKWSKKRNYNGNKYFLKDCNSLPRPIEPEFIKKILNKIRGKPRDRATLHASGIEIVSPSFMNQRVLAPEKMFIPERLRISGPNFVVEKDVEDRILDKAEEAGQLEQIRNSIQDLEAAIEAAKKDSDMEKVKLLKTQKKQLLQQLPETK